MWFWELRALQFSQKDIIRCVTYESGKISSSHQSWLCLGVKHRGVEDNYQYNLMFGLFKTYTINLLYTRTVAL